MVTAIVETPRPPPARAPRPARPGRWLAGWAALVAAAAAWGTVAVSGTGQGLGAAPLVGRWDGRGDVRLLGAVALAAAAVALGPRLARTARWPAVALGTGAAASAWAALLAAGEGWATRFESPVDYLPFATGIDSPFGFLGTFTERAADYPVHVKGHPPGATLVFWALDRVGLSGPGWAGVAVVIAWGVAAGAVVVALAGTAGRDSARRAAPFLALAPGAVWAAFSADAFFAAAVAVGLALVVSATGRRDRPGRWLAAGGGAVLGSALHLTYGAVPLLLVAAAVVVRRRRWDLILPAAIGAAAVTALFVAGGFWWLDGLELTRAEYRAGIASRRPWPYHLLVGNPAAFALAAGPALALALGRIRRADPGPWLLAAAALAAVAVADASGLSKGEVERIWLPFLPWVLSATATLPDGWVRPALAAQAGTGLALQVLVRSPW